MEGIHYNLILGSIQIIVILYNLRQNFICNRDYSDSETTISDWRTLNSQIDKIERDIIELQIGNEIDNTPEHTDHFSDDEVFNTTGLDLTIPNLTKSVSFKSIIEPLDL